MKDILIKNVDIDLLRKQRDYLLTCYGETTDEKIDGIINLLDHILDTGEAEE